MTDPAQRERFATYFPSVFAYVHSWAGDDERCREIVVEAFARVFNRRALLNDEDFPVALFSVVRDLCEGWRSSSRASSGGLSAPEREVLALLFDAQLTRGQVGSLLQIQEDTVASMLVRALRKLKGVVTSSPSHSLQQL
jgi:DNA-directed RNA polymerase specialized sigma24 family protein